MIMQLYIIRHGQSYNNALWSRTGSGNGRLPDPPLTEIGQQQAVHLSRYIAEADSAIIPDGGHNPHNRYGYHLTHLYSSLMLRAVQTGHVLAESLNMTLQAWPIIHEWGGIFEYDPESGEPVTQAGPNHAFFSERFANLLLPDDLGAEGWWGKRPFETESATYERAKQFVSQLLQRHGDSDDRVGIVTHGGFTSMIFSVIFSTQEINHSLRPEATRTMLVNNNTALTRLDIEDDQITLVYLNRLDHLPANLITW